MSFNGEKFGAAMKAVVDDAKQQLVKLLDDEKKKRIEVTKQLTDTISQLVDNLSGQADLIKRLSDELEIIRNDNNDLRKDLSEVRDIKMQKGDKGDKGDDGLSISSAFIQQDGQLVLVQSNGETKSIGKVKGDDGKDGKSLEVVNREFRDGCIIESYVSGAEVKTLSYPVGFNAKGFWQKGESAGVGDVYTHNGSAWVAKTATATEPAYMNDAWHLLVRKGADGRDADRVKKSDPVKVRK